MSIDLKLRGVFLCRGSDGADITPRGAREKGILALLALAPERTRSRNWLKTKLWSERFDTQANTSLRRALSNIRKAFGAYADCLITDRINIRLAPDVIILNDAASGGELLEDLFINDPEFDDWLRDTRMFFDAPQQPSAIESPAPHTPCRRVMSISTDEAVSGEAGLLQNMLGDILAERLVATGPVEVYRDQRIDPKTPHDRINVSAYPVGSQWVFSLSIVEAPKSRHVWSGRTRIDFTAKSNGESNPFARFCNEAIAALADRKINLASNSDPFFVMNFASARLFTGQNSDLGIGLTLLDTVVSHQTDAALPLAWRGFAKLTKALDSSDTTTELAVSAMEDASKAVALSSSNSTALALAAHVHLLLAGDADYARFLAQKALTINEQDPYAGFAAGTAAFYNGETQRGLDLVRWSRECAQPLTNSFFWDVQNAILGLSTHDFDDCYSSALLASAKMPTYRPALRYLIAIALLKDLPDEANRYVQRLRQLEPHFDVRRFTEDEYPVPSLRRVGLSEETVSRAARMIEQ